MEEDTIVAVATPPGRAALGVVRISGPAGLTIARALSGRNLPDRVAVLSAVVASGGRALDEGVITAFHGPRSYTGEDLVEISCHGSPVIVDWIVNECLALGARAARPGEFTLRAFLNGRIDLAQAEAVVDLVEARSQAGLGLALAQLGGELGRRVDPVRASLLGVLAHITALVEFSEEDIPPIAKDEIEAPLARAETEIQRLMANAGQGQVLMHGVSLAIIGPPNAGKSSILNALLGRNRAIVTPIAGTTRDTLEEELTLGGILFRVIDTAGLTDSADPVESMGVERSREAAATADVVLLVVDAGRTLAEEDREVIAAAAGMRCDLPAQSRSKSLVVALNKSDLPARTGSGDLADLPPDRVVVHTSTVEGAGLNELRTVLPRSALGGPAPDGFVISNVRHLRSLSRALGAVGDALRGQAEGVPLDLVSLDIRRAVDALGEILGVGAGEDILDSVFSRFCIGK